MQGEGAHAERERITAPVGGERLRTTLKVVEPAAPPPASLVSSTPWERFPSLNRKDLLVVAGLLLLSITLNLPALNALEFFRHTEADRTLIAWEMAERNDFVVPRLLGSVILTKPPLFYWLLAGSISLFNSAAEWVVRLPSFFCALIFVAAHYLLVRLAGAPRGFATRSALFLCTGGAFLQLAVAAEIDLLFGFLCALGQGLSLLANLRTSRSYTLLTYLALALGVMTKGPIAVVFVLLPHLFLAAYLKRPQFGANLLGALLAFGIPALWVAALTAEVGMARLLAVQEVEHLHRFFGPDRKTHGPWFYLPAVVITLLPWSLLLIGGTFAFAKRWRALSRFGPQLIRGTRAAITPRELFIVHLLLTVGLGIALLMIADGKANRYLFPLYAALIHLCALATDSLVKTGARKLITGLVLLVLIVRAGEIYLFAPLRNHSRSVKPIAQEINEQLPAGAVLYTLDFPERWLNYYLKRLGRESRIVTAADIFWNEAAPTQVFALISAKDNRGALPHYRQCDPTLQIVKELPDLRDPALLLAVNSRALPCLSALKNLHSDA